MARPGGAYTYGPGSIDIANEADGNVVVVPDAHLLFSAEFDRVVDDLRLTGPDDAQTIVRDYFAAENSPILMSADGAIVTPEMVATLVGPLAPAQYAQVTVPGAAEPIGQVETLTGTAEAVRVDGSVVQLTLGESLFRGDVVRTGPDSKCNISFEDDTVFSITENSRITLDSFVYDPGGASNSMVLSLVQGTFSFVTGQIASTGDMTVNTPVVALGIRGTTVHVTVNAVDGTISVSVSDGFVDFFNPLTGTRIDGTSDTGSLFVFRTVGVPPVATPKPLELIEEEENRANEIQEIQATVRQRTEVEPEAEEQQAEAPEEVPQTEAGPNVQSSGSSVAAGLSLEDDAIVETELASFEELLGLIAIARFNDTAPPELALQESDLPNSGVDQERLDIAGILSGASDEPVIIIIDDEARNFSGPGSGFVADGLIVGETGEGSLTLSDGSTVVTGFAILGAELGSSGSILIETGSELDALGTSAFVIVGDNGFGELLISDGSVLVINGLDGAFPGLEVGGSLSGDTGSGTVTVTDPGSAIVFEGDTPFAQVGDAGPGTLNVTNGGTVQGVTFLVIGRLSTGIGTVNLSGANSNIMLTGTASAAAAALSEPVSAAGGPFLNVGAEGSGILNISAGAGFFIEEASVLSEFNSAGFSVGGSSFFPGGDGILNVDGAGSTLVVDANETFFSVGRNGGTGDLNITAGGAVLLTGGALGFIGRDGVGTVVIDGAGSTLTVGDGTGNDSGTLLVGVDGGIGSITLSDGGLLNAFFLEIGREAGDGTVTVTDPGTVVTLSDAFGSSAPPFEQDGAFLRVARDAGSVGELNVLNGAVVNLIANDGFSGPGIQIARNNGSVGTALVDNATINVTQLGPLLNFGPLIDVGRGGEGRLTIQNGGALNVTGPEIFFAVGQNFGADGTLVIQGGGTVNLIGDNAFVTVGLSEGSEGLLDISGAGSFELTGQAGTIRVGNAGEGVANITGGGFLTGFTFMDIGRFSSSTAIVTVDGAGSSIELEGIGFGFGAFLDIGRFGAGTLSVLNGASVVINGLNGPEPGFQAGRNVGGEGTIIVDGANSNITILSDLADLNAGSIAIGRSGTGDLQITSGGTVTNAATGVMYIGALAGDGGGGVGTVFVEGTAANVSTLNAGAELRIGGVGTGTLTIGDFGTVNAGDVFINTGGTVQGTGPGGDATVNAALNADTITLDGGILAAGFSAGTLTMNGDFTMNSGMLNIELGGTGTGQSDLIDISGSATLGGGLLAVTLIDGYLPSADDSIVFLMADDGLVASEALSLAISGVTQDFQAGLEVGDTSLSLSMLVDAEAGDSMVFLGGSGDDEFFGGLGDDRLEGGAGNDMLSGGAGSDVLVGGAGSDLFILRTGDGGETLALADLLTDFEDGFDMIGLESSLTYADLTLTDANAGDTAISVTETGEILTVVQNVSPDLLDASDFSLVTY